MPALVSRTNEENCSDREEPESGQSKRSQTRKKRDKERRKRIQERGKNVDKQTEFASGGLASRILIFTFRALLESLVGGWGASSSQVTKQSSTGWGGRYAWLLTRVLRDTQPSSRGLGKGE